MGELVPTTGLLVGDMDGNPDGALEVVTVGAKLPSTGSGDVDGLADTSMTGAEVVGDGVAS